MVDKKRLDALREASGRVVYTDPLTSFFYQLIRDEMPAGKVEHIVQDVIAEGGQECLFTNGWLAQYANNLAEMIRNAHTEKLKESLEKAFDGEEKEREVAVIAAREKAFSLRNGGTLEDFTSEELAVLEEKVVVACKKKDIATEVEDESTPEEWSAFAEADEMIENLKLAGSITTADAERLKKELAQAEEEMAAGLTEEEEISDDAVEVVSVGACDTTAPVSVETSTNGEAFESGTLTVSSNKWENTQTMLDEIDKELDVLVKPPISNTETKVEFLAGPIVVSQEEVKEIEQMFSSGLGKILEGTEAKKEE